MGRTSNNVRRGVAAALLAAWLTAPASATETCSYAGTSDYNGELSVTATADKSGGALIVDVAASVEATQFWLKLHYEMQERSVWHGLRLDDLAMNTRYFVGAHIVRQIWDRFQRGPGGMQAWRVQGKKPDEFLRKFPAFAGQWAPGAFGQPWVESFQALPPERRPDLDLPASDTAPDLNAPFALAFYWDRFAPPGGLAAPVFMAGFKTDKIMRIALAPQPGGAWRAPLHYIALSENPPSGAIAQVSKDHHLERLSFELHGSAGSAHGVLHALGCQGSPVSP